MDDRVRGLRLSLQDVAREVKDVSEGRVGHLRIGVGESINESQMEDLDDLETGTDVDLWDHKLASEMRVLQEIFAEVVDKNARVADNGTIYDPRGQVVRDFKDGGLPAYFEFELPAGADYFTLEVNGVRIHQPLTEQGKAPPPERVVPEGQDAEADALWQARAEAHHAVGCCTGAGDDRKAEHEQPVREQRAHDRRPRHDELAGREGEEDDEELGQVPEGGLQCSGDRRSEALADRLRCDRDRPREPAEGDGRDDEDRHGLDVREVEDARDDGEREDAGEDGGVPAHARTLVAAPGGSFHGSITS